jgi:membrane protein DedA with SNARE-associated domain
MAEIVTSVIGTLGYIGIFFLMLIEVVFPPIPSEVILPFAGFAAAQGTLSIGGVIVTAALGATAGGTVVYWLGKLLHQEKIERFILQYGSWLGIKQGDIDKSQRWFDRHGYRAVFLGRMVPIVRTFISLPAGIRRMNFIPFLIYTFIGSLAWSTLLASAGYVLGDQYQRVEAYLKPVTLAVIFLFFISVGIWLSRRLYLNTKSKRLDLSPIEKEPSSTKE